MIYLAKYGFVKSSSHQKKEEGRRKEGGAVDPMALFLLLLSFVAFTSDSASISRDAISSDLPTSSVSQRHLLQVKNRCPVDLQSKNYTIITSVCKGPNYPVQKCCGALVIFACPFASDLNDNTTDCASVMFTYINLYGNYPAGLFANGCRGDAAGLPCPPMASPSLSGDPSHAVLRWPQSRALLVLSTFLAIVIAGGLAILF